MVVVGSVLGLFAAVQALYFTRGLIPGDALVYLAAGERLNDGHELYRLVPGDRPVGFKPPFWNVPLLSPPLIAVIWRPLAALPNEIGPYVWWIATIGAVAGTIAAMIRRRPFLTSAAVLVLMFPLVYEIGVGNVNALLLLGTVLAWKLAVDRRDTAAGAIVGTMVAIKLTPAVLVWWFLTQRRWTAVGAAAAAGLVALVVGVLGAGWQAHLEYIDIVRTTTTLGTSDLSVGGMARFVGVSEEVASLLPRVALVAGLALTWLVRSRPHAAFAVAVATVVLGSPVVNINWFAYLLAALAPAVWPLRRPAETA